VDDRPYPVELAAGLFHTCVRLGDGSRENVRRLAPGSSNDCAVDTNGRVLCRGSNTRGGDGAAGRVGGVRDQALPTLGGIA
jgi:hypothetical protein